MFELETGPQFSQAPRSRSILRLVDFADGTLKFEPDDVVMLKVMPAYETMLVNRGR